MCLHLHNKSTLHMKMEDHVPQNLTMEWSSLMKCHPCSMTFNNWKERRVCPLPPSLDRHMEEISKNEKRNLLAMSTLNVMNPLFSASATCVVLWRLKSCPDLFRRGHRWKCISNLRCGRELCAPPPPSGLGRFFCSLSLAPPLKILHLHLV